MTEKTGALFKLKEYLNDYVLVTDTLTRLTLTFGVVLVIGGLYLMLTDTSGLATAQKSIAALTAVSTVSWVPGIPFAPADLTANGIAFIGLITWLIGVDLILVGLGLWVRHRFARWAAILIFALAGIFQGIQFIYAGFVGAPAAVVSGVIDVVFVYLLYSRFDSPNQPSKQPLKAL